jgi:hypothetical protein
MDLDLDSADSFGWVGCDEISDVAVGCGSVLWLPH